MSEWAVLSTNALVTKEMIKDFIREQGGEWQNLDGGHEQGAIGRYGGWVWIWGDPSVERETWDDEEWEGLLTRLGGDVRSQIGIQIAMMSSGAGSRRLLPEIASAMLREWGGVLDGPDWLMQQWGVPASLPNDQA